MNLNELLMPHFTIAQYGEFFLRVIIAGLCGAAIGYERSKRLKEAGVRTHLIVCVASALLMVVSKYGFRDLVSSAGDAILGTKGADPARIAAQVVSGVGFIGAGVIFHNDNSVKGLTTAAGLWATSGIGIAIGSGLYILGILTTAMITILQLILHKYASKMDNISTIMIGVYFKNSKESREEVINQLQSLNAEVTESKFKIEDNGKAKYSVLLRMTKPITVDEINKLFEDNDDVVGINFTTINN